jgi:hypothetical protein
MEIEVKRAPKGLLRDDTPYYEVWRGEGGRTLIEERLFMLGHEGSVEEIKLTPNYRIGANYAYTPVEEGEGESYEESIKRAGFSIEKNNFIILKREYRNWHPEFVDELTIIILDDD